MQSSFMLAELGGEPQFPWGAIGGTVGLILTILALFLAVLWLIFPFFVYNKLSTLETEAKRQTELLERISENTKEALPDITKSKVHLSRSDVLLEEEGSGSKYFFAAVGVVLLFGIAIAVIRRMAGTN